MTLSNHKPELHIPEPPYRPGDTPDYSGFDFPAAGAYGRPDPFVDPKTIRDLPFGLIRVLDDDHKAVGAWDPKLDPDALRLGLRHMVLTRIYDDRMLKMQRQGKMSFYMKSTGEEAVSVAQGMALRDDDMLFPSYRQQGLLITRGRELVDMICHCLSNARDNCKGRQLPVMYSWKEGNFFSISGNLATQFCQAVGWAMAAAYKGDESLAIAWMGDGSTAEADFHYGMTFASVYNAPVILNVVNNQWAISTYQSIAGGEHTTFASRAIGYAIPGLRVDGNDFLAVYAATAWAAERARKGGGPTLIELYTYRAEGHSTSDDPSRYRPAHEYEAWPLGDPVERLKNHLLSIGEWSEDRHAALEKELGELVTRSYREAERYGTLNEGPRPPVSEMFEDVFKEPLPHLRRQRQQLGR